MTIRRWTIIAALATAALAAGGCGSHSTRVFSYEVPVVWQTCLRETVIWRPDRINEDDLEISSTRMLLGGGALRYELKVTPEVPMWGRPRTKVAVRIAMVSEAPDGPGPAVRDGGPPNQRHTQQEVDFLDRISRGLPVVARVPTDRYDQ